MEEYTIYSLWALLISRKSVGTATCYDLSLKRFQSDNGMDVTFEDITPTFIDNWREKMKQNLSKTSLNIHLRSFSAVMHFAYECQLIKTPPKFLFRGLNIFSHHSSNSRKHCFLPVCEWWKIWKFYEKEGKGYPQVRDWSKAHLKRQMEALGLMLFMYLANGMNLCDVLLLRYDAFYFQTEGKQLQFCRHKTAERTGTIVEFPILPEMQIIIDRLGQKPQKDALVFPYLRNTIGDRLKEYKRTADLGHIIRKRMRNIAQALHLPAIPTPTWARHSFATNLTHAGVSKDYIMWAMGHSNYSVTSHYIASYSFEQMIEHNSLLLHSARTCEYILSQVDTLPDEEKERLVEKLLATRTQEAHRLPKYVSHSDW